MDKSSVKQNLRRQVAVEAARLMMEQSITDYRMAKNKAALRLGLQGHAALPTNQEVEEALLENRRLFLGAKSDQSVARLRAAAIDAMRLLHQFRPRLVGAVLSGAITSASAVEMHLFSDDVESVSMALIDFGINYDLLERKVRIRADEYQLTPVYCFEKDGVEFDAYVFRFKGERQPPLSPIDGKPMARVDEKGVSELLSNAQSTSVIDGFFA